MTVTVYGIPNCDSVKKALASLKARGLTVHFHDFRKAGLTADLLQAWLKQVDLAVLINRKGTTWRGLADADKARADSLPNAIALLLETPTLIKRPVVDMDGKLTVGQTAF